MNSASRSVTIFISVGAVVFCLTWALAMGRDLNWDQLNYHLYVPLSFATDRISQDFLPASIQSYLNPVSYLPFYWMVKAGWPSIAIALTLATVHALNLVAIAVLCSRVLRSELAPAWILVLLGVVLAAVSPVFLTELGSSFNDVIVSAFVLWGLVVLIGPQHSGRRQHVLFLVSGVLFGMAVGLKLTAVLFVPGALLACLQLATRPRLAPLLRLAFGMVGGLSTVHGYWGFKLWLAFRNPFFPYFNQVFQSPDFPAVEINPERFRPDTLTEGLLLPFRMADFRAWIYTENNAPDVRFAVVLGMLVLLIGWLAISRFWRRGTTPTIASPVRAVLTFFFVSLVLWIFGSGNGRYGMPIMLLAGPVLVWLSHTLVGDKWGRVLPALVVAVQSIQITYAGNVHWSPTHWGPSWFEAEIPSKLTSSPYLFLSAGQQSYAYLAAFVHPESSFANVIGQFSISENGSGSDKFQALLDRHRGRVRFIRGFPRMAYANSQPSAKIEETINRLFGRLGYHMDGSDCVEIVMRGPDKVFEAFSEGGRSQGRENEGESHVRLLSCALVEGARVGTEFFNTRKEVARVLDAIEDQCPALFDPKRPALERGLTYWTRHYVNSETFLAVDPVADQVLFERVHDIRTYSFGRYSDWKAEDASRKGLLDSKICKGRAWLWS